MLFGTLVVFYLFHVNASGSLLVALLPGSFMLCRVLSCISLSVLPTEAEAMIRLISA